MNDIHGNPIPHPKGGRSVAARPAHDKIERLIRSKP